VAEVFAGFIAGYALAVITTPMLSFLLIRLRLESDLMGRLLPEGTSAVGLSVLLHGGLALFWTAMGILLGLVLYAMRDAGGALGSLNGPYTLFVAAIFVMIGAPLFTFIAPARRLVATSVALAILVFGWLTPYLAEWSAD
jgi:hypothetical protein